MGAAEIKADVLKWWEGVPAAGVSMQIIEFIERLPVSEWEMLTYSTLLKALDKNEIDDDFLAAINILTNSHINALEIHGLFVDEDGQEHEMGSDELADARLSGTFIHPDTGVEVRDFEERIIPFFTPSARFRTHTRSAGSQ
ncbi:hypothetical protein [Methylocystis hirsuta]|uniref:Uncharacterized protein n=1 Tax=Methylocystis hirsuta TaxID=369798 RepID=A0A3M9XJ68_9HYPH|nr:hypothetical protein [Methylocystis hirsuta]RNJ48253.1 hypothetical protein D1O30_00065 [Methylocystis hirsuta]